MRTRRLLAGPTLVAALALTGCASGPAQPLPSLQPGTTDRWTVTVSQPRFRSDERCGSDPSVDNAVLSADLPSSGLGITFKPGASEDDAVRVAECLQGALESGDISILSPRLP